MSTIPHDTLLAILREITKPIGEHLAKRKMEYVDCVSFGCGDSDCDVCRNKPIEDAHNAAIESILDSRDIVLAVVRYYEGSVSGEDLWHVRQLTDDQLHSLVRETWGLRGDGK